MATGTGARLLFSGETSVGMKRKHNEDSYSIMEQHQLFVVADGMGGHASGEVASRMAIDILGEFIEVTSADLEVTWPYKMDRTKGYEENRLITGIKLANLRIYEAAQRDPGLRGMGTTLVSVLVARNSVLIGHVGDSRVYRLRAGNLEQLTEDHSLLNDYIRMKRLSEEEIENFPHKNVIVRALGMKDNVRVDVMQDQPQRGDIYLLCSDGLSGPVSDADIARIVNSSDDLNQACSRLIQKANEQGGPDNVTVVMAKWLGA